MFDKTNITKQLEPYTAAVQAYVLSLRDVRNVGLLVFTVIVLLISWSRGQVHPKPLRIAKTGGAATAGEPVCRAWKMRILALQNQYYGTNQYLDVTARENLGLGAPGETELLVPQNVALAHTVKDARRQQVKLGSYRKLPFWQRNFQNWIAFFFHPCPTSSN